MNKADLIKVLRSEDLNFGNCLVSAIIGSLLGAVSSVMINSTLYEISMDPFFSVVSIRRLCLTQKYFAAIFSFIGYMILCAPATNRKIKLNEERLYLMNIFGYSVYYYFINFILVIYNCFD